MSAINDRVQTTYAYQTDHKNTLVFKVMAVFGFPQVQQKTKEDMISLHIPSSVGADRGKYVITATNEMGNDTGVINVVVMGLYSLLCFDWPSVCPVVLIVLI